MLEPYTPTGSTMDVSFNTSKATRFWSRPDRSHLNWIITDSDWEAKLARVIEDHPMTRAYAKNHNLGFEIPYLEEGEPKRYRPDFLITLATPEPTTLIVEAKGFRDAKDRMKAETTRHQWVPGVNTLGRFGRWVYAELLDPYAYAEDLDRLIAQTVGEPA